MHDAFLTLEPFTASHLTMLERWLQRDHVKSWFPDTASAMDRATQPPEGSGQAVIYYRRVPVGYVRWQRVNPQSLQIQGLPDLPEGTVDIEILIGEESQRGQTIGPGALHVLCKRLAHRGDVPLATLTASADNHSARRACEKAGFEITGPYTPPGQETCYLFTRVPGAIED